MCEILKESSTFCGVSDRNYAFHGVPDSDGGRGSGGGGWNADADGAGAGDATAGENFGRLRCNPDSSWVCMTARASQDGLCGERTGRPKTTGPSPEGTDSGPACYASAVLV